MLRSKIMLYIFSGIFIIAGINHFRVPEIYLQIIPPYLPQPNFLNYASGTLEIISGIMLLFKSSKRLSAMVIICVLITFVPAHIYMIQIAPFHLGSIYVTVLAAWIRLPLQILLICWALPYTKKSL